MLPVLYLAVAVAAAGCAGGQAPTDEAAALSAGSTVEDSLRAAEEVRDPDWAPEDFAILTGMTGMGAGQMRGYQINADGKVFRWSGRAAGQNPTDLGFISENQADSLWKWTREADFFAVASQAGGNQTQFLSITANGTTRRASWVVGPGIRRHDGPSQGLYDDIVEMIEGLEN